MSDNLLPLVWREAWAGLRQPAMSVLEPWRGVQVQLAPWEPGVVSVDIWGLGNLAMTISQAKHLALALTTAVDRAEVTT